MDSSPYFSIIIVNFQSAEMLSLSLRSLYSLETETDLFEVLVVNNDERERHAVARLAMAFPIRVIEHDTNTGFGQGANSAASSARGTVMGFLNPDTKWQQPCLVSMRTWYQKQSVPVILGIPLFGENGHPEPWSKGLAPSLWRLLIANMGLRNDDSQQEPLDWVSGGSLFISKELFVNLGGFSKDYFLYFEDVDLCIRAKQSGASVRTAPFGAILHSGGRSFPSAFQKKMSYYGSQKVYFRKHRPMGEYFLVALFHRLFHGL